MTARMRTALGRYVDVDNCRAYHMDTVFELIRNFDESPFNPEHQVLEIHGLCNSTGLNEQDVRSVCDEMVGMGLLLRASGNLYRSNPERSGLLVRVMDLEERVAELEDRVSQVE